MGTPDLLALRDVSILRRGCGRKGGRGAGGKRSRLSFSAETAKAQIVGPDNSLLKKPEPIKVDFLVHRDRKATRR